MTDLTSWLTGGGAAVMAVGLSVKSYFTKRKEYDLKIIQLEKEVAVHDAVQDERLKEHDRRIDKLENR